MMESLPVESVDVPRLCGLPGPGTSWKARILTAPGTENHPGAGTEAVPRLWS